MKGRRVEPRGLGDTLANLTFIKGISKIVGKENCEGCKKRQDILNKIVPYKNKEK